MLLIGSANAAVGMDEGWQLLVSGGTALDAVEAVARAVEDNPADHTVGYGGYPNLVGVVELDASVMDGTTRRAGAVGALQGFRHAVTVARHVMTDLPHVLVVGDGAARFARSLGMPEEDLLTAEAERAWRDGLDGRLPADYRNQSGVIESMLASAAHLAADPDTVPGTVNVLAIDAAGHLASAVSTSGWAWKHPGRLGDSPLIGSGNYADDRYGAAGCTGWGELAIRCCTARSVVSALAQGVSVDEACDRAIRDIAELPELPDESLMHVVAVGRDGAHAAVSSIGGSYVVRLDGMARFEERERRVVALR
jgi:beta-aspartyl-peptidase (threonine type)